jgi:hypothetical protein
MEAASKLIVFLEEVQAPIHHVEETEKPVMKPPRIFWPYIYARTLCLFYYQTLVTFLILLHLKGQKCKVNVFGCVCFVNQL